MDNHESRPPIYADALLAHLQLIWGAGFLSPGGPGEVAELLGGVQVAGREVLDLGCGVGGPALELIRAHGAGRVLGVDVETGVLERARQAAEAAGLAGRAHFRLVERGALPVEPGSFDVVFSKDVLMAVEDKRPIYADVFRILRPGGWFVASDWLRKDGPVSPAMRRWLLFASGLVGMKSLAETARLLEAAGFVNVEIVNRNEWYLAEARRDLARMEGPLWPGLVAARSEQAAAEALEFWRLMIGVLDSGDLCPAHVRAQKQ